MAAATSERLAWIAAIPARAWIRHEFITAANWAIMFISMAATVNAGRSVDEIVDEVAAQVTAILPT